MKLGRFGINTDLMARYDGFTTSSSLVTTRPDGARPTLHKGGATGGFYITDTQMDRMLDTKILHVGRVGLMNCMDTGRTEEIMAEAKRCGVTTTLDVFSSTPDDLPKVARLLPHTDYFFPSKEPRALSGLGDNRDLAQFLLDRAAGCAILTLGRQGAFYRHRDGTEFQTLSYTVDVKCTCGCGDCFNGGFAKGLYLGCHQGQCRIGASVVGAERNWPWQSGWGAPSGHNARLHRHHTAQDGRTGLTTRLPARPGMVYPVPNSSRGDDAIPQPASRCHAAARRAARPAPRGAARG